MSRSPAELQSLLASQPLAALGTVHGGEPFVSMVPFALLREPHNCRIIIHVSTLAKHTQQMLDNPRVSLMVMAEASPSVSAQATPRVTIQGTSNRLDSASEDYAKAKAAYLARFADSDYLFDFSDFSLFAISPDSARWVAGFAKAKTLSREVFCAQLQI